MMKLPKKKRARAYIGVMVVLLVVVVFAVWQYKNQSTILSLRTALSAKVCSVPCWQHIVPGVTDLKLLEPILNQVDGDINIINTLYGEEYVYEWHHEDKILTRSNPNRVYTVVVIFDEDKTVLRVMVPVDVCIASVLSEYDPPIHVDVSEDDFNIYYYLLYPDEGLIFNINGHDLTRVTGVVRTTEAAVQEESVFSERHSWQELQHIFEGDCIDNFSN